MDPTSIEPFIQFGLLGIILAWFMFRMEKKMDDLREAVENVANILLRK